MEKEKWKLTIKWSEFHINQHKIRTNRREREGMPSKWERKNCTKSQGEECGCGQKSERASDGTIVGKSAIPCSTKDKGEIVKKVTVY